MTIDKLIDKLNEIKSVNGNINVEFGEDCVDCYGHSFDTTDKIDFKVVNNILQLYKKDFYA